MQEEERVGEEDRLRERQRVWIKEGVMLGQRKRQGLIGERLRERVWERCTIWRQ